MTPAQAELRTILPMEVPCPAVPPAAQPFRGDGTPATKYCPLPFYHLTKYVSPFRMAITHQSARNHPVSAGLGDFRCRLVCRGRVENPVDT